jgi:uncharacterized LabA/DUF88 family protein
MADPNSRWMLFVDGENLTIRGQKVAEFYGLQLKEGNLWQRDAFMWLKNVPAHHFIWAPELNSSGGYKSGNERVAATRCYYYTGVKGDDGKLTEVRRALRQLGFDPQVFKKDKPNQTTKAVDISLATEILSLAHHEAFDIAVLIAGDRDYVPLLKAVKRTGKRVFVSFFAGIPEAGLSEELQLEADLFLDLTALFREKVAQGSSA